ncbi:hypothetical protein ONZ45_g1494 [Pleurotus djamor]|nr:hypothetical protein ONZ45_g1494 [Pleurotus djamor]
MPNVTEDASRNYVYTDPETFETTTYNSGDIAWVLTCMALVWLMIPGLGFFYSGLLRRKNALSMMWLSFMCIGVVSFQWFFWGYSLTFSETGSAYIGNLKYFALQNVLDQPSMGSDKLPALVFCIYQCMFACITPMIAVGAIAERARVGPLLVFVFIWTTIVYDPLACWTWNANGWSFVLGGLDFAGGTPVHISSGTAALAISVYLGKRRGYGTERLAYKPHNTTYVFLGTVFLWIGWFGFNGGSALAASLKAIQACIVTNLSAAVGGITWMLWDYRLEKRWPLVGFCSGAIAGLVAITPAAGFVGAPAAVAFGFLAGTIFAAHGVGGILGNLLTALFAQASVAGFDGVEIPGGWFDHHYIQLAHQLADSVAGVAYAFGMTTIILWILHFIPFLRVRCDEATEILGVDDKELGEYAYDYVNLELEIGHSPKMEVGAVGGAREPDHKIPQKHHEESSGSEHEK